MTIQLGNRFRRLLGLSILVVASCMLVCVVAVSVYSGLGYVYGQSVVSVAIKPVISADPSSAKKPVFPSGLPARLSIPSIGVDAVIDPVGLTSDGAMDIKTDPDQVAWYKLGTRPGDEGSAVIAGHSGWTGTHGSIFNNLSVLKPGDDIVVVDQKGTTRTFAVRESRQYDPTADAAAIFQSYDSKAHLNLVTCEGAWVRATHSFTHRLVVFADLK